MQIPKRFFVGALLHIGFTINMFQRGAFSIAILQVKEETEWSESTQGLLLASFYWGYICTTAIGGWLSQRIGPKLTALFSAVFASALYILLPFAVPNVPGTLFLYVLIGAFQGVYVPALYSILSHWYPESEHSTITAIFNLGTSVGTLIGFGVGPFIILNARWPSIFFVSGGLGLLWSILWCLFVTDFPMDENLMWQTGQDEVDHIIAGQPPNKYEEQDPPATPWKKLFRSPHVWALYLGHFAGNWGQYVFSSWMPTYIKEELNYDLAESGIYSFLPFILMGITNLFSGWISDVIVNKQWVSKTRSRKVFQVLVATPAICFILLGSMDLTAMQVIALFCISIGMLGFAGGSSDVNFLDLTSLHTGKLFSVSNTIATLPGVVGVYIVGYLLDETENGWQITFFLSAAIFIVTLMCWLLFATTDPILDEIGEDHPLVETETDSKI